MTSLIPRFALPRLAERVAAFRVVIVNGPRQAGKTTLLRHFQAEHSGSFRSLDDASTLAVAHDDPTEFARYGAPPRIVDEIQRGGDPLVLAIKQVVDTTNDRGQFILSGSTRFLTVPTLSESLAGRAVFVDLWQLTAAERFGASGDFCDRLFAGREAFTGAGSSPWTRRDYLDLMTAGGYPEAQGLPASTLRQGWFDGYLNTVILRDVQSFAQVQHVEIIPRLLAMVAARAGSVTALSSLARGLEVSHATARNYLTYLDTVFLIGRLPPWSSRIAARHVKSPKYYPTDSGMAAHLLQVDGATAAAPGDPKVAAVVETFVFAELTRLLAATDIGASLNFYRDSDGREIDFLLERRDGRVAAVEVKTSSTVGPQDFRHLRWLRQALGDRFAGGYVLYLGDATHPVADGMLALPLSAMWHHRR